MRMQMVLNSVIVIDSVAGVVATGPPREHIFHIFHKSQPLIYESLFILSLSLVGRAKLIPNTVTPSEYP
jgi:hypothetical protein